MIVEQSVEPTVEATCRSAGNIDLALIKSKGATPLASICRTLDILDLPHGGVNSIWVLDLLESVRQRKLGALLDGWGGNLTISWDGNRRHYLHKLLKRGDWRTYCREVNAWHDSSDVPLWRKVVNEILTPLLPAAPVERSRLRTMRHKRILKKTVLRSLDNDPRVLKMDLEVTRSANPGLYHYHRNGQSAECGLVPLIQGLRFFGLTNLVVGWTMGRISDARRTL